MADEEGEKGDVVAGKPREAESGRPRHLIPRCSAGYASGKMQVIPHLDKSCFYFMVETKGN